MADWIRMPFGVMCGVWLSMGVLNGILIVVLIDDRLVCEKLTIFPYVECIIEFCK